MIVQLGKELSSAELSLIQKVALTLDGSFEIIVNKNKAKELVVVYNNYISPCSVSAIRVLITGIDELDTNSCMLSDRNNQTYLKDSKQSYNCNKSWFC